VVLELTDDCGPRGLGRWGDGLRRFFGASLEFPWKFAPATDFKPLFCGDDASIEGDFP